LHIPDVSYLRYVYNGYYINRCSQGAFKRITKTEGAMSLLIFALIIIVLVAAFSLQNAAPVTISFLLWKFQASLAIVIFLSVLIGATIATIIAFWLKFRKKEQKLD